MNKFLPMFPLKNIEETKTYIQNRYTAKYTQNKGFYYAICLKENDIPMGYVHISEDDSHDLGYGIKKEFWQPKNILVTFRMYQLNFDNQEDRIYKKYWDTYPIHFIEEI